MSNISWLLIKTAFEQRARGCEHGERCNKSAQARTGLSSEAAKRIDFARLYLYYEYLRFISLYFSLCCVAVIKDILCFQRKERFCHPATTCSEG
jgi:hypothetical protein